MSNLTDDDKRWISENLEAIQTRVDNRFIGVENRLIEVEDRLIEHMRGMQTELLRGFAAFSEGMTLRLSKVEADQSNLDAALSGRVAVLERRLLEIEKRLHLQP